MPKWKVGEIVSVEWPESRYGIALVGAWDGRVVAEDGHKITVHFEYPAYEAGGAIQRDSDGRTGRTGGQRGRSKSANQDGPSPAAPNAPPLVAVDRDWPGSFFDLAWNLVRRVSITSICGIALSSPPGNLAPRPLGK